MRRFDCFVGIDWSGDKESWQKGLKIAVAAPRAGPPKLKHGPGPKGRWSRTAAAAFIGGLAKEKRALIGIDFAFGFPPLPSTMDNLVLDWEYVERFCRSDANLYGGRFFSVADAPHAHLVNSPHFKLPTRCYSARHLRATDRVAAKTKGATPQSIFNACGPAQVGPASISGMRALLRLRQLCGQELSIWPFDGLHAKKSVIVEIFPRYFPLSRNRSPKLADHRNLNAALAAFGCRPVESAPASEDEGDALFRQPHFGIYPPTPHCSACRTIQ